MSDDLWARRKQTVRYNRMLDLLFARSRLLNDLFSNFLQPLQNIPSSEIYSPHDARNRRQSSPSLTQIVSDIVEHGWRAQIWDTGDYRVTSVATREFRAPDAREATCGAVWALSVNTLLHAMVILVL
jgi:hypothetical protein